MNARELLEKQHREAKTLIDELERCPTEDRERLLGALASALRGHARIEEEHLYPRLQETEELAPLVRDGWDDHDEMREAIGDLERLGDVSGDDFTDLVQRLEDIVDDHVEIEETEVFPEMERIFSAEDLEQIGSEMERSFHRLEQEHEVHA